MSEPRVRGKRVERSRMALALRAEGLSHQDIADRMGVTRSYVGDLLSDPDGSAARQRKDSYAGVCEECGGPTDGANGPAKAPRLCKTCAPAARRVWTQDSVIYAIRLWAMRHGNGQPPSATDWIRSSEDDDGTRYPSSSTVYSAEGAPFDSWADAIQAAGFERPTTGRRHRNRRGTMMAATKQREYVVFRVDASTGLLVIIADAVLASTNREAVEEASDRAGVYYSVPKAGLMRFDVAQRYTAIRATDPVDVTAHTYDPTHE
jgi:transcriptional regulator with XRE-family HTH domain